MLGQLNGAQTFVLIGLGLVLFAWLAAHALTELRRVAVAKLRDHQASETDCPAPEPSMPDDPENGDRQ